MLSMRLWALIIVAVFGMIMVLSEAEAEPGEPVIIGTGACYPWPPCSAESHSFTSSLRQAGYTVIAPSYTNNNLNNANVLRNAIDSARKNSPTGKVKVIGASMGGFSGLYTLKNLGMNKYVSEFITVDSPMFGHPSNTWLCLDLWFNSGNGGGHLCKSGSYYQSLHSGDPTPGSTRYSMVLNDSNDGFAGQINPDVLNGVACIARFNMSHMAMFNSQEVAQAVITMLEGSCP